MMQVRLTVWKFKKAVLVLNETFSELKLQKHPDKTLMGRIEKGFDFLGYHFGPQGGQGGFGLRGLTIPTS